MIQALFKAFAGFIVGGFVYAIAVLVTNYDGFVTIVVLPFASAFFSGLTVLLSLLVGLLLRLPPLKRLWNSLGWSALFIPAIALLVMIFHTELGLETTGIHPEFETEVKIMSPAAAVIAYFLTVFPFVHLPVKLPNDSPIQ